MQTQTCRTGTRHLFLRAIPDVGDCENKYAVQTMSTLTMKLFLSRCPPIGGRCKQERREHAWPVTHCGRNFGLSSASGLRSDSRSADARSPFSAGCAALCVFTQGFMWSVLEPGITTCAHTPKENSEFPHLPKVLIPTRGKKTVDFLVHCGIFPDSWGWRGPFQLQTLWPESAPKVTGRDDPCCFPKQKHLGLAKKKNEEDVWL